MLLHTDPQGYAFACAAIRDMDQRRLGALISAPTLVIGGESDPTYVQILAERTSTMLKLTNKDGKQQLIKP